MKSQALLSLLSLTALVRTADAACTTAASNTDRAGAMTHGCCLVANTLAEVWVDSGKDLNDASTGTAGVDSDTCGAAGSPCLSLKWAYHVRVSNSGTVKVVAGRLFKGADNRNLYDTTGGSIATPEGGPEFCTRHSSNIESVDKTNRAVIDLEHAGRFLAIGGWTDPVTTQGLATGGAGAYGMNAQGAVMTVSNLVFKRGRAPNPSANVLAGLADYATVMGLGQAEVTCNEAAGLCSCNRTALGLLANATCPKQQSKLGCGGVITATGATLTLNNCDFVESFALLGGAICNIATTLKITGEPVMASGVQQPTSYQATYEKHTGSYCNFERNLAWGPQNFQTLGAAGAIWIGNMYYFNIGLENPSLEITGCNFFRHLAWNPRSGVLGNGGVISSLHNDGFAFKVINSSFTENWAKRGAVYFTGDSRDTLNLQLWSNNKKSIGTMVAEWEGVTAVRNGYWDQAALTGCDKAVADSVGIVCEYWDPANGLYGGLRGVFKNAGTDYAWSGIPNVYWVAETKWIDQNGNPQLQLDPLERYSCQGYDADAITLAEGNEYMANRFPKEFYQNCGTPGITTKLYFDMAPYGGSTILGVLTAHGGVWYSYGTQNLHLTVKKSTFIQNRAGSKGGAFYVGDGYFSLMGKIVFEDSRFIRNRAQDGGGINTAIVSPSAPYGRINPSPSLADNLLVESKLQFIRCEFTANMALKRGAAIVQEFPLTGSQYGLDGAYPLSPAGAPATIFNPVQVRPPVCPLQANNAQEPCEPVWMKSIGTRFPLGTKVKMEIIGTPQPHGATVTPSNADSKYMYNMNGWSGGVVHMGAQYSSSNGVSLGVGASFSATDTYFGGNGARIGLKDGHQNGGVLSILNDPRRRSTSCYPIPDSATNPFSCGNVTNSVSSACPAGRYGKCHGFNVAQGQKAYCYDACAYENFEVVDNPADSAGKATVFDEELNHDITFTRCDISKNVAHDNGGVVFYEQTVRDAATITFSQCNIQNNGAFKSGGVVHQGYPAGSSQQQADIRSGKDNFVGKVNLLNCTLTGNTAGTAGGVLTLGDHAVLMSQSTSSGSYSSYQENHWADIVYTCQQPCCSQLGGPNYDDPAICDILIEGGVDSVDYGAFKSTEIDMIKTKRDDVAATGGVGGFLSNAGVLCSKLEVTILDSTISTSAALEGGSFFLSGTPEYSGRFGVGGASKPYNYNSNTQDGTALAQRFKCDGMRNYSWSAPTTATVVAHSTTSVTACNVHAALTRVSLAKNMAVREKTSMFAAGGVLSLGGTNVGFDLLGSVVSESGGDNYGTFYLFFGDSRLNILPDENGLGSQLLHSYVNVEAASVWAVAVNSEIYMRQAEIYGSTMMSGVSGSIAMGMDLSVATLDNCTLRHNFAGTYGGIRLKLNAKLIMMNSVIKQNVAAQYAPVLYTDGTANVTIKNCRFLDNEAYGYDTRGAGVMMATEASQLTIMDSFFENNKAVFVGGCLQIRGGAKLRISGTKFIKNNASSGGALFIEHDIGGVWNSTSLTATPQDLPGRPDVVITNTEFSNNVAQESGGAIGILNARVDCSNCVGSNNNAAQGGGFVALLHTNATLTLTDSNVTGNSADMSGGAFYSIALQEGDTRRANYWSTPLNNNVDTASLVGSANGLGGRLVLTRTQVVSNRATSHGGAFAFWYWPNTPVIDAWSAVRILNNQAGGGGIAFKLERGTSYNITAFAARLVLPTPGMTALDTVSDNVANYGNKFAASGSMLSLTKRYPTYKFSPGLLYNPSTLTATNPDGLRIHINSSLRDGFNQVVTEANNMICFASGSHPQANGEQMAGGTRKTISTAGVCHYQDLKLTGFFGTNTTVQIECTQDESAVLTMPQTLRKGTFPLGSTNIQADDCKQGWAPVFSQRISNWVRMCAPCGEGFFSHAINSPCYSCPIGASSVEGLAFGIRGCFCPAQKYIAYNDFSGNPQQAREMKCQDCNTGEACTGYSYPVPEKNYWMYRGEREVYECPFEDSCKGFAEGYSAVSTQDPNYLAAVARHTTARRAVTNWDAVANEQCKDGYKGVLCAVCKDDYQLTATGCQPCSGDPAQVLRTWIGLGMMLLIGVPLVLFAALKVYKAVKNSEEEDRVDEEESLDLEGNQAELNAPENKRSGHAQAAMMMNTLQTYDTNQQVLNNVQAESESESESESGSEESSGSSSTEENGDEAENQDEEEEEEDEDDEFWEDQVNQDMEEGAETEQDEVDDGGDDPMAALEGQVTVLTSHLQVMSSFTSSISLEWPAAFGDFCSIFAILNFDLTSVFALGCVSSVDFYGTVQLTFWLPTGIFLLLVTSAVICIRYLGLDETSVKNKHWLCALYVMFIIYPGCCTTFLGMFLCHTVEGKDYLRADYSLECYDDKWAGNAVVAVFGILLYCFGIPFLDFVLLFQNKHKLFIEEKFKARFGFVYARYEEEFFYWELVEMLRKFTMSGVLMFINTGSFEQILMGVVLSVIFLLLYFRYQPFDFDMDDNLAVAGGLSTTATLLLAVLLRAGTGGTGANVMILLVNLLVLGVALFQIFCDIIPKFIEKSQQKIDRAMWAAKKFASASGSAETPEEDSDDANRDTQARFEVKRDTDPIGVPEKYSDPIGIPAKERDPDLISIQKTYFARYDLDLSDTISSSEELTQLCTNLAVRLNLRLKGSDLERLVKEAGDMEEKQWDFDEFKEWFDENLLTFRETN